MAQINKFTIRRIVKKRDYAHERLVYNENYESVLEQLLEKKSQRVLNRKELKAKKRLYMLEIAATDPDNRMEARKSEMDFYLEKTSMDRRAVEQTYARLERKQADITAKVEMNKVMAGHMENDAEHMRNDVPILRKTASELRDAARQTGLAKMNVSDPAKALELSMQIKDYTEKAQYAEKNARLYERQIPKIEKKIRKMTDREQGLLDEVQELEKKAAEKRKAACTAFARIDSKTEAYEKKLDVTFPRNDHSKALDADIARYETAQKAEDLKIDAFKKKTELKNQTTMKKAREKIARDKHRYQTIFDTSLQTLLSHHESIEMDGDHILSIRNMVMHFAGVKAVDDVSFDIKRGEIFGLIGPNGAGKTTLFNCITQFYKPTGGQVFYRDEFGYVTNLLDYASHDIIKTGIVRTFQNLELVLDLPVLDNLLIAAHTFMGANITQQFLHTKGMRDEEQVYRIQAQRILKRLNLEQYQYLPPRGLPYGILKKVELARTLMAKPKLIILDEPAAGLNGTETEDFAGTIRQIRDEYDCTVFLVEHDMGLVMSICDTVCAISFGKKLAIGTPEFIQNDPAVQEAYLGVKEATT